MKQNNEEILKDFVLAVYVGDIVEIERTSCRVLSIGYSDKVLERLKIIVEKMRQDYPFNHISKNCFSLMN